MGDFVRRIWTADGMRMIEVGELAAAAHVSAGYLHRLFRIAADWARPRAGVGPAGAGGNFVAAQ